MIRGGQGQESDEMRHWNHVLRQGKLTKRKRGLKVLEKAKLIVMVVFVCFFLGSGAYHDSFAQGWVKAKSFPALAHGAAFTLLPSGKVLIFRGPGGVLFDPDKNTTQGIKKPSISRLCSMPVLWRDKVYFVGGRENPRTYLDSVACYSPEGDSWENYPILVKRWYPGAIPLRDGRILIMGGFTGSKLTKTCEIFDPSANTSEVTGDMLSPGLFPSATLMKNGKVFIGPGLEGNFQIYDPDSGEWSAISLPSVKDANFMVRSDGSIFIIGGENEERESLGTCFIYDPFRDEYSSAPSLKSPRRQAHSVRLPTGEIFIVGGESRRIKLKSCESFINDEWFTLLPAPFLVGHHGAAVLLTDGSVLVVGDTGRMAVYEPGYFSEVRPVIVNKEAGVLGNDGEFQLEVQSENPIGEVCLIAVNAVTHHNNSGGNRYLLPEFSIESSTATSSILNVHVLEELPPGSSWLAFALDDRNIPSEAKFLTIE